MDDGFYDVSLKNNKSKEKIVDIELTVSPSKSERIKRNRTNSESVNLITRLQGDL